MGRPFEEEDGSTNELPPQPTRDDWSRRDIVVAVLFALGFLSWLGLVLWVQSVAIGSLRKSRK